MTRRHLVQGVASWLALSLLAGFGSCARMRIDPIDGPNEALAAWGLGALQGDEDAAPGAWTGPGPNVVTAWEQGVPLQRYVGDGDFVADVQAALAEFERRPGQRFTIEVGVGDAPVVLGIPYLRALSLVPLNEGLVATLDGERRVISPEELRASGAYDRGIVTPIPDLTVGSDVLGLVGRLARDMGHDQEEFLSRGEVRRFRSLTIAADEYPKDAEVTVEALRSAAIEGAEFLLRHQNSEGMYAYIYDARSGRPMMDGYNIPRHSGATYFLAQVDRVTGHPQARAGAMRALRFLERTRLEQCDGNLCIVDFGRADVGSAALTVVAASEVLLQGEDPLARRLVEGLSAFLRAQQREDGELMHEFNIETGEPIDVQHLYYSGEAAFALLRAYRATGDERNAEAARRLMTHLTGASWDFLGSRYYYGEEHWTCIAAGEGRESAPSDEAIDFCRRWWEWNDVLQFRDGETPWPVGGAYGVGPVVMPRLTPVGSRTEAFIGTYLMLRDAGMETAGVRALVERGLGQLLRYRWAPGPTHLFADPGGAQGGVPGSPIDLSARNDFVQHAGSSWVRWLEVLQEEQSEQ